MPHERGGRDFIVIKRAKLSLVESVPQWQTIYCSLILLLVVFFIMLIAYSEIDKGRFRHIKSIVQVENGMPVQTNSMNQAMQSFRQLAIDLKMADDFAIVRTESGFKAVVPNPILFGSGDASLNESVYSILDGIIEISKNNDLSIQVDGHTDNRPIETPKFPSNWELSTMRAVNILRYLEKKGGISQNRLAAVGFAEFRPMASNDTPEGRQMNRRIEISFKPGI